MHELTGGRFRLGLGVSHEPVTRASAWTSGRPLADMRAYVEALHAGENRPAPDLPGHDAGQDAGAAAEIGDGAIWANAARSAHGAPARPGAGGRRDGFFFANMIPTVIDDDQAAADAINRRTLTGYVTLPNYRNYWKQAGYVEEMEAIEAALAAGDRDRVPALMSDALAARLHARRLGRRGARRASRRGGTGRHCRSP